MTHEKLNIDEDKSKKDSRAYQEALHEKEEMSVKNMDTSCPKNKQASIPAASYSPDELWVKEYVNQFGTEPSFF